MNTAVLATTTTTFRRGAEVTFRPGTPADSYAAFNVYVEAISDPGSLADAQECERRWQRVAPVFAYVAATAENFYLAERHGKTIGFARTILRDGVRELTEFFVVPGEQSSGVGRELLTLAFPKVGAKHRVIIATHNANAQSLYLRQGLYPRFPIYRIAGEAIPNPTPSELVPRRMAASRETLALLNAIDKMVLGHRREADQAWLLRHRPGYLYYRDHVPIGYGYVGEVNGPFAFLDEAMFPAVLAHVESACAAHRVKLELQVPAVNHSAIGYLLTQGYRIDLFIVHLMSDEPLGKFNHYIMTRPMFFL